MNEINKLVNEIMDGSRNIPVNQNQQQKQQMAAGNPCQPEPINPKNKLLYLECQWKPHKSIIVELKLSKPENI